MGYSNGRKRVFPAVVLHYHCRREPQCLIFGQIGNAFQHRPRFSRKNAFLQAEISGIDLHAVIFMVEQAVQNIDAFASGFVAAQVFSHFFFDALQRLGRAIAQFDFFLVPLVILRQLDFGKLRDHKIIICCHFKPPNNAMQITLV